MHSRRSKTVEMKIIQGIKILCPIDFDVNSLAALDLAHDLVRENGGTVYALHVVKLPDPLLMSAPLLVEQARQFARISLDEVARESLGDVEHLLVLRTGRPAVQIIDAAAELAVHLLVMATHGRTGVSRLLLGSVAESVIRESPCPVLTVRGVSSYQLCRMAESHTGP